MSLGTLPAPSQAANEFLSATEQNRNSRRNKTGMMELEGKSAENWCPTESWRAVQSPKAKVWVEDDVDKFAQGGGNLERTSVELNGVVIVDLPCATQGEVEIEQGGWRARAKSQKVFDLSLLAKEIGDLASRSAGSLIQTGNLHLENGIGLEVVGNLGMSEKSHEPSLKGAEAALDFALGLWGWSHEMGDIQSSQSTLEFAPWVTTVTAGTWAKEAECVSVDGLGDAVEFKGFAKVLKMSPRGVGGNKAAGHIGSRAIINGEQEGLLAGIGPPLMNGAIVLPKFTDLCPAKASKNARFFWCGGDQVSKMFFDVSLYRGSGTGERA